MKLGRKPHTVGNITIYSVDYSDWLDDGVTLASATVVKDPATPVTDVTISAVSHTQSNRVLFTVAGGSLNETFTVDVQITDSRGEIKNDTADFFVVAP